MIRKAEAKDVYSIVSLEKKTFGHTIGDTFLLQEIEDNPFASYWVYDSEGVILGYIGSRILDDTIEIINFVVDPMYQSKGYGIALMDHLIHVETAKKVILEVRKSNEKAKRFYTKYGFVKAYIRKDYYENHEDAYVMIKEV